MTDMPERVRMCRDPIVGFKKSLFGGTEYIHIDKYEDLEASLKTEHEQHVEQVQIHADYLNSCELEIEADNRNVADLMDQVDKQGAVLDSIRSWCKAYPLTVFPKPDYTICGPALKEVGQTVDAISADCQRHLLETISKMINELEGE